jgi:hypothetical protein
MTPARPRPIRRPSAPLPLEIAKPPPPTAPVELEQYLVLVNMVLGDRAKAERLIALEASKTPGASREQCIDLAIELLRYDLGR